MPGQAVVTIGERQWQAGVAVTYAELTAGLRGVASLPAGTGLLFVLGQEQAVDITTQGMAFPIDVVFISGALQVVEVAESVSPGLLLSQSTPVSYFLEVNAGEAAGIQAGDLVSLSFSQEAAEDTGDWISPVVTLAAVMMLGTTFAGMSRSMAEVMRSKPTQKGTLYGPQGERLLPPARKGVDLLPDSPEFLAYTIEDIGYREKIDAAFLEAITRARRGR